MIKYYTYNYPVGDLTIEENGTAITRVSLTDPPTDGIREETVLIKMADSQLREYFTGKRKMFDLPVEPSGTPFQQKVWSELTGIGYGESISYKELAARTGNPRACRAVGGANNRNPIIIVIPCHRVVGADGSLTGYAGGMDNKKFLLDLEAACR